MSSLASRVTVRSRSLVSSICLSSCRASLRSSIRQQSRRGYANGPVKGLRSGSSIFASLAAGIAAAGSLGYHVACKTDREAMETNGHPINTNAATASEEKRKVFNPKLEDYQAVYDEVASRLVEYDEYDDGSYGPVVLRLAWHASGTYDKETGTGGSNGATMRFDPESEHGSNSSLKNARDFLEPVKKKFPWISYSDFWTLSGVAAIQEMAGPIIPWRPGRSDRDASWCTPDGRLPDGAKALSGAHALGRCHEDRSGFEGPWTFSPTMLTNDFYKLLMEEKWINKDWKGPKQFQDVSTKSLMMLPSDMALIKDSEFKKYVERYAISNDEFFKDFSKAVCKLFELGVPFQTGEGSRFQFKRSE